MRRPGRASRLRELRAKCPGLALLVEALWHNHTCCIVPSGPRFYSGSTGKGVV